jgi:hypothetical protein
MENFPFLAMTRKIWLSKSKKTEYLIQQELPTCKGGHEDSSLFLLAVL